MRKILCGDVLYHILITLKVVGLLGYEHRMFNPPYGVFDTALRTAQTTIQFS